MTILQSAVCIACLLLAPLVLVGTEATAQDDAEELIQYYRDLVSHRDELIATRDDPEASEIDRINARETLDKLNLQIGELEQEMKRSGIDIVRVKPGGDVTAEDPPAGAKATKAAASPCDRYEDYARPLTSTYTLPPMNRQSGTQRNLAQAILSVENELIQVSVECQDQWDFQKVTAWASRRQSLADTLVDLERRYALTFAPSVSQEEDAIFAEAYKDRPEIRQLVMQERELFDKYMDIKEKNDAISKKFAGKIPDAAAKLRRNQGLAMEERARAEWRKVASRWNELLRTELAGVRRARAKRLERAIAEMKKLHPGTQFELHDARDFLRAKSPILVHLLGQRGVKILEAEGARRRVAAGGGH